MDQMRELKGDIRKKWADQVQKYQTSMAKMSTQVNTMTDQFSKKIANDVVSEIFSRFSQKSDKNVPAITTLGGGGKKRSKRSKKKRSKRKKTKRRKSKKKSSRRR